MRNNGAWLAFGAVASMTCSPIEHAATSSAPLNDCSSHPCPGYSPSSSPPACVDGACVVDAGAPSDLVVVVAVPAGARTGASRSYAMRLGDLLKTAIVTPGCPAAGCVRLPQEVTVAGSYTVQGTDAEQIHSTLVTAAITSLPVHVTYRPLWPPDAPSAASDALTAGLSVYPVQALGTLASPGTTSAPGPGGGSPLGFQTYVQPKINYERTVAPDSPFDQEIPPDVDIVAEPVADQIEGVPGASPTGFDTTPSLSGLPSFPTYELSSAMGSIDGWKAYLRDATTKRPISPIKTLSGNATPDGGLFLPTNHHPPVPASMPTAVPDALNNAELVMVPSDPNLPTEVFHFPSVFQNAYAKLPPPVQVSGAIAWPDGLPPVADVVFEATSIYVASSVDPSGAADGGADDDAGDIAPTAFVPQANFEFSVEVPTELDGSGQSTYSVSLPRGIYRAIVRPYDRVDGSPAIVHGVVIDAFDTGDGTGGGGDDGGDSEMPFASTGVPAPLTLDFVVTPAARVAGAAMLTDGRALSGATVEALPLACPVLSLDGGAVPKDSPRCLPRSAQTVTDIDGSYGMPLDNGTYLLRVEPAAGTRLPWVWQTIVVSGPQSVNFLVPAPAQIGLALLALPTSSTASVRLADYAVADAIVRLFVPPAPGSPAIEAARTITDATGRFDFYFDPSIR